MSKRDVGLLDKAFPISGGFAVQGLVKVSGNFVLSLDSLTLVVSVLSEITQIDFSVSVTSEGSLTENGHGHYMKNVVGIVLSSGRSFYK